MVIIHHFLIMMCHFSFKCIIHHQCIILLKYILHINYMKTKLKILHFLYIFLDKGHENQVKNALKVKVKNLILLVIPLISEN
ncbi:hypothetical protein V6Z11_D07G197500 [Gossypium hirsutum]